MSLSAVLNFTTLELRLLTRKENKQCLKCYVTSAGLFGGAVERRSCNHKGLFNVLGRYSQYHQESSWHVFEIFHSSSRKRRLDINAETTL
jgi:hypothetical protein